LVKINTMKKFNKSLVYSEIFPPMHGGSGRWFWEVYSRLDHDKYIVLAGSAEGDKEFDQNSALTIERMPFLYKSWSDWGLTSIKGLKFYAKLFIDTLKIVNKHSIEAIHCGRCIPEGFVAYLIKKIKGTSYYCYIHGEDVENAATSRSLSWVVSRALKNADLLICNSENSKKLLLAHWNVKEANVQVIHPGVDTKKFVPAATNLDIRNKLNWHDRPVLLTVSRLEERKGHDMLIRALVDIKQRIPNVLYAIIGGGPQEELLKSLVAKLKLEENVLFMSEISDQAMIECYQQCDIFVLPNRDIGRNIEGFGIVMLEAQSCGIPVIGGDSGGTPETIDEGNTGFIVNCDTTAQLIGKVEQLLTDKPLRNNMGENGRIWAHQFDWEEQSIKLDALFKKFDS